MIIGRTIRNYFSWRFLKPIAEPTVCKLCHTFTENFPMNLPVADMVSRRQMENPGCILCGTCVDGCKQEAIRYGRE